MRVIDVKRLGAGEGEGGGRFSVRVAEDGGETRHEVTVAPADFDELARGGETGEAFVERCFVFLLEREPKEAILARFDASVIGRYFPEWRGAMRGSGASRS